ncbi:MAG TPA: hypothetical protein VJ549_02325 [Geothrix sp.]|nr:hypothetical protein [Geothrix sp.]
MELKSTRSFSDPQTGGITIVVTLMLLVLITVAAMGMSRNALRELAISGTSRQGAMARNVADSGIEWCVYWVNQYNAPSATGTALKLNELKLQLNQNPSQAGIAYDPMTLAPYNLTTLPTPPSDLTISNANGTTQGFTVALTRMGKLPITDMSQGVSQGSFSPATGSVPLQAPDLWALRSDSQITVGTGPFASTFFHSKEAWISTPAQ